MDRPSDVPPPSLIDAIRFLLPILTDDRFHDEIITLLEAGADHGPSRDITAPRVSGFIRRIYRLSSDPVPAPYIHPLLTTIFGHPANRQNSAATWISHINLLRTGAAMIDILYTPPPKLPISLAANPLKYVEYARRERLPGTTVHPGHTDIDCNDIACSLTNGMMFDDGMGDICRRLRDLFLSIVSTAPAVLGDDFRRFAQWHYELFKCQHTPYVKPYFIRHVLCDMPISIIDCHSQSAFCAYCATDNSGDTWIIALFTPMTSLTSEQIMAPFKEAGGVALAFSCMHPNGSLVRCSSPQYMVASGSKDRSAKHLLVLCRIELPIEHTTVGTTLVHASVRPIDQREDDDRFDLHIGSCPLQSGSVDFGLDGDRTFSVGDHRLTIISKCVGSRLAATSSPSSGNQQKGPTTVRHGDLAYVASPRPDNLD